MATKQMSDFINYAETVLSDWDMCDKLWPNHSKNERDYDIEGINFNYIYHRYNYSFKDRFTYMWYNTPTFTNELLYTLASHYMKKVSLDREQSTVLFQFITINFKQYVIDTWDSCGKLTST